MEWQNRIVAPPRALTGAEPPAFGGWRATRAVRWAYPNDNKFNRFAVRRIL